MTRTVEPLVEAAIANVLRGVIDPELGDNIVDLGMVQRIDVDADNSVASTVALATAGCPLRAQLMNDIKIRVGTLPGVAAVRVHFGEMSTEQKRNVMSRARWKAQEHAPATTIPPTCRIVAIASGKGGVGKSSVTVNLAALLAQRGLTVGVLDADIGGFSIPRMLEVGGTVVARSTDIGKAPRAKHRTRADQGRVDGLDHRCGRGRGDHVARSHAQPSRTALHRRRRLGRPRLPADRPATRHSGHSDGPRPDVTPHGRHHRHHPSARRAPPEPRPRHSNRVVERSQPIRSNLS